MKPISNWQEAISYLAGRNATLKISHDPIAGSVKVDIEIGEALIRWDGSITFSRGLIEGDPAMAGTALVSAALNVQYSLGDHIEDPQEV